MSGLEELLQRGAWGTDSVTPQPQAAFPLRSSSSDHGTEGATL